MWLDSQLERAKAVAGERLSLELDVQGVQCAACVWLMSELYQRRGGGAGLEVNPALGKVSLRCARNFDVAGWVRHVESFGYQFGPPHAAKKAGTDPLTLRLGISAALGLNVMLFSLSFYFGLSPSDGDVFNLFIWLSLALSTVTVAVGGWPFFAAAVRGFKAKVLHLDLPIALGIVLVWAVSVVQALGGHGHLLYLDTLNVFITLMLLGRWLQVRLVERNRRYLLEDDGADGLWVRRLEGQALVTVNAPKLKAGDAVLVAPGDVVPLDGVLASPSAELATEWMTGEPSSSLLQLGAAVSAGSVNVGRAAFMLTASQDFAQSQLVTLLRRPVQRGHLYTRFWDALARRWVVTVLGVSTAGFLAWLSEGVARATDVAAGLLVVTCPCAIGLAIPLAYEFTQQRLRSHGFFSRAEDLFDRLLAVRTVIFDKTGTLTLGRLELCAPQAIEALSPAASAAAYNLSARSNHPVSRCLFAALEKQNAAFVPGLDIIEEPGAGLTWRTAEGHIWRLGKPSWALSGGAPLADVAGVTVAVLSYDGALVSDLSVRETLRAGAAAEVAALSARGLQVWLLSGDRQSRVATMAERLGLAPQQAIGDLSPEAKAEQVKQLDRRDTLYLGDGVNDALAFEAATVAGTPAVDRPVLPARSDFFLLGEGIGGLREGLEAAAQLRATVRQLLAIALVYNLAAVAAGMAGALTPLRAAVAMPLSTLSLLAFTTWRLGRRTSAARTVALPSPMPRAAEVHP